MPEHEREARQTALLADYERQLATDPAATPPPGLDPALATVARLLEQELGAPRPERAATPDPAFKLALRQRLAEQAAALARPAAPAASPVARSLPAVPRDRHGRPLPPTPVVTPAANGTGPRLRTAALRHTPPDTAPAPARPRPVRAAVATGAGWLGAALVILIVILAATLLLRGLPQSTPAVQPETPPAPSVVPTAPMIIPPTPTPLPAGPSWREAAAMGTPRTSHTATLLPDGRVLVTGGMRAPMSSEDGFLASAEMYDPATDRWSPAAPMDTPRRSHTATLLQDGRVLVAGGYPATAEGGSLASVEIYDPRADRWTSVASMNAARGDHTATLLTDGRVLITGGYNYRNSGEVTSAEIFDSAADRWAITGAGIAFDSRQAATLLADGTVLITGGGDRGGDTAPPSVRFDPATDSWQQAAPLTPGRVGHGTALLPNGQLLAVGGQAIIASPTDPLVLGPPLATALRYDPATNTWNAASSLSFDRGRTYAEIVTLASGQILVIGGVGGSDAQEAASTVERYDSAADRWLAVGVLSLRFGHTATRLADGRVLVTGGLSEGGNSVASAMLYTDGPVVPVASATPAATPRPAAPLWQVTGALATARERHAVVTLQDGRVLAIGGSAFNQQFASVERYDPATGVWSPVASLNTPRADHTATVLRDGRVLVVGGFTSSQGQDEFLATTELYDPATDRWTFGPPLAVGRSLHSATLLFDSRASSPAAEPVTGQVLVVGGMDGRGLVQSAERFDPAIERWLPAGSMTTVRGEHAATALPDGTAIVAGGIDASGEALATAERYNPETNDWQPVASMATPRYGHAAVYVNYFQVMVIGGMNRLDGNGNLLVAAERYDAQNDRWIELPPMSVARYQPLAVGLSGSRVLVIGATYTSGSSERAELYDISTDSWGAAGAASNPHPRGAATELTNGRVLVVGGALYSGNSATFLSTVELYTDSPTPPQMPQHPRGATPTPAGTPVAQVPPSNSAGSIDWNSQQSGLLLHAGRGYRLRELTQPNGTGPSIGEQVGTTTLRLQSGGVFPAGTPIYGVAGRASDEWVALQDGDRVYAYQRDDSATALLQGFQVVIGTVADAGTTVCPGYGCPKTPEQQQAGTIATAQRVTIERSLQGSLASGQTIEVRQMGTSSAAWPGDRFVRLQPGDRVLFFLAPGQRESFGDFGFGDHYWTAAGYIYRLAGDQATLVGSLANDGPVPLADFEAAVAELFRDVTPLAPTDPRPTPRPIPTATGIVPLPTAPLPATAATPTPTSGP